MALFWLFPLPVMANALSGFLNQQGIEPLKNTLYSESCGECHFAYFPGLLPSRSWRKMMEPSELEDHFGESAELDEEDRRIVLEFLISHAAEVAKNYKRSIQISRSIAAFATPLRITDVAYIKKKHRKLSRQMVQDNAKVRSLSYCNRCHRHIGDGVFNRREVSIPGFPDWQK